MQERDAITRLKAGDIRGLETLVRQYQGPAFRAAFLICRDAAQAEDIVQTAFVRAYERIAQFTDGRPFGPWFIRGVVNDALKQVTRDRQVPWSDEIPEPTAPAGESPEALLAAAETRRTIWAALDRLSPGQRAAIVLRYYGNLDDGQMAAALDCPPGTVRRRLHDARQRLRHLLPEWVRPTG